MTSMQRFLRLSVLLPAGMMLILVMLAAVAGQSWLQNQQQMRVLKDVAGRDAIARSAALALSGAADAINARLLGVLADVYSPAGSVQQIERQFGDFETNWKLLSESMPEARQASLADIEAGVQAFRKQNEAMLAALKSQDKKNVAKVYDGFIEHAVPFRRKLVAVANDLDKYVSEELQSLTRESGQALAQTMVFSSLAMVTGLAVAIYALFGVARPISRLIDIVHALQTGRTEIEIPATRRTDEIGTLMTALASFRESLEATTALRAEQANRAEQAEQDRKAMLCKLVANLENAVGSALSSIADAGCKLDNNAGALTALVQTTKDKASIVAKASASATEGIQSVATASGQLMAAIAEINQRVDVSTAITGEAVEQAHAAGQVISELERSIGDIASVLDLIRAIASQTNLLALNATIEAARAGEAGRGFAVVASEVKQLAMQTARATDDIASHIGSIRSAGGNVASSMTQIRGTIGRLTEIATEIASSVNEQHMATNEISSRVARASLDAEHISAAIREVTGMADTTGVQAKDVAEAVSALSDESDVLRDKIERFVAETRAA
jgi:methyl-accepting chemotaxis protein